MSVHVARATVAPDANRGSAGPSRTTASSVWSRVEPLPRHRVDGEIRAPIQQRAGHDLAHIRTHTSPGADRPARTPAALGHALGETEARTRCACGGLVGSDGKCAACRARRLARQTALFDGDRPARVTSKPSESPRLLPTDVAAALQTTCHKRCGKLIGGSFGETECDVDPKSNMPTGTVLVTVTDTDPCTRPCVELHEAVHEQHLRPVCRELHTCLTRNPADAAQVRCWELFTRRIESTAPATECAAYRVEADCFRKRREDKACASDESRKRLERRQRGVDCYKECFCGGVAAATRRAK